MKRAPAAGVEAIFAQLEADGATYADLHPAMVRATAAGEFTIVDLLDSLQWFRNAADWTAWRAFLCALYALPMTAQELAIYRECTGRVDPPTTPAKQAWVPVGRRGRKSAVAALIAVFEGAFRDYTPYVAPGERPTIPILSKSMDEAKQIASYAKAILSDLNLQYLLDEEPQAETIRLTSGVDIRIKAASKTAGRSRTIVLALLDEVAFFPTDDAAEPDVEIVRGIEPAMAMIPTAKLIGMSSPFGKAGLLWENYRDHFGKDTPGKLIWQAPTLRMHNAPQIRAHVEAAYADDPVSAAAEFGAQFRDDQAGFLGDDLLVRCTMPGVLEVPPGAQNYFAFVDVSGGTSDSFTLAVAHLEEPERGASGAMLKGRAVLDFVREWQAPLDPDVVTAEAAAILRQYGVTLVRGDKYAGEWPRSRFRAHGISFVHSERSKSEIYLEMLPAFNGARAWLVDDARLRLQFTSLARRIRGNRESVDHKPGKHDDMANAAAGALLDALTRGAGLPAAVPKRPAPQSTQEVVAQRLTAALERAASAKRSHTNLSPYGRR